MQLKRILAIFLAAALIFSALTVSVGAEPLEEIFEVGVAAETTTPVSSSPAIYNAGEDVTVTISADQNTGFDYLKLKVSYDPEALELVDYTSNKLFGADSLETINPKTGYVLFTAILNSVSITTGEMFTLNFKTKADFCGETEITAQLSADNANNCMITDPAKKAIVPFVGGTAGFAVHDIDAATGVITAPTCTEVGYTTYVCAKCEESVVGDIVAENGHTEAAAVEENRVEADCTNDGSYDMVVYCEVCKTELSRATSSITAHGHSIVKHDAKAPTCTEKGWDAYESCSKCDYTTYVEKSPLGHTVVNYAAKAPTCTEKGWDAYVTCTKCNYTTYAEKAALGHSIVKHDAKAPTCTEKGWDAYETCSKCNYTTYAEKAALGHSMVKHEAKAPTCTEKGCDAYEACSRCNQSTYVEKAALGHHFIDYVSDNNATCTEDGTKTAKCDRCDVTNTVTDANSAAHKFSSDTDAECDVCGEVLAERCPTMLKDAETGKWYYYVNGEKSTETTLVKYNGKWFYIVNGEWDKSVTNTLVKYSGKWFYIKGGKWDSSITDLVKYKGKWFYIRYGKWDSTNATLFKKNDKWFAIKAGKWYKGESTISYSDKLFYVKDGFAQLGFTGKVTIGSTAYNIKAGKVV